MIALHQNHLTETLFVPRFVAGSDSTENSRIYISNLGGGAVDVRFKIFKYDTSTVASNTEDVNLAQYQTRVISSTDLGGDITSLVAGTYKVAIQSAPGGLIGAVVKTVTSDGRSAYNAIAVPSAQTTGATTVFEGP